jgi:hypothetical protein
MLDHILLTVNNTLFIHCDSIMRLLYYVFLSISLTYSRGVAKDVFKNYANLFERKHLE